MWGYEKDKVLVLSLPVDIDYALYHNRDRWTWFRYLRRRVKAEVYYRLDMCRGQGRLKAWANWPRASVTMGTSSRS
ncbi:hypothetical protein TNCV_4019151 [Trichonephila clavipes]|nr:hypothetical protein TNCV_4019151 [Trichonephila clavipes]